MKFTIGTLSSNLEFEDDLKLIKSSLLYADEVELIGMAEYAVYKYFPKQLSNTKDVFDLLTCMVPFLNSLDNAETKDLANQLLSVSSELEEYKPLLKKKRRRTKEEIFVQMKISYGTGVVKRYYRNKLLYIKDNIRPVLGTIKNRRLSKKLIMDRHGAEKISSAYSLGYRMFDSGRIYGHSEVVIGKGIKQKNRKNYYLTTKISDMDIFREWS